MPHVLCCPHCGQPLLYGERIYVCGAGHTFDLSARRYVNLLIDQSAAVHGDDKAMISARRQFLSGGYYEPLRRAVIAAVLERLPQRGVLLDAGCGEGWYTDGVCRALSDAGREACAYGIDISKDALRYAGALPSVREGLLTLAVASAYRMPIASESVDAVLNLFAPFVPSEYTRVLKQGGTLLYAVPERYHLWGLKQVLYDTPYENRVEDSALAGYTLLREEEIRAEITLESGEAIESLFAMTPYCHRTPREGRERLHSLNSLKTPIHFRIFLYQKD